MVPQEMLLHLLVHGQHHLGRIFGIARRCAQQPPRGSQQLSRKARQLPLVKVEVVLDQAPGTWGCPNDQVQTGFESIFINPPTLDHARLAIEPVCDKPQATLGVEGSIVFSILALLQQNCAKCQRQRQTGRRLAFRTSVAQLQVEVRPV